MNPLRNPYAAFLHGLDKPARYIGGEHFIIRKVWDEIESKVALCFPDVYEIGMSHLGTKIIYQELNKEKDILAERCFAPWGDMEKKLREHQLPLVSLENFKPLKDFDIVGFSLQFEMTYTNILNMLDLGGIPLWQKDRQEKDPFVIAGGPCATHPETLAEFLDIVLIGDAEDLYIRVIRQIRELKKQKNLSRHQILEELAEIEGLYIPHITDITQKKIHRHIAGSLKEREFPVKSPIPHATAIFDKFAVELSRGCTEGCRFCQAGIIYRPVRERDPKHVINSVMEGMQNGGFREASLTCLSTADYSAITPLLIELLDKLKKENSTLGIASLRAYGLNEKVLDKMSEVQNTSLTFAPEAGTQRLRNVINKNISEENILQAAENIFARGWTKMKLYFMIGLPTETDEDVRGIMETGKKVKEVAHKMGIRRPDITISVSSFVPKPHTPFQWCEMISMKEIQRKQEILFQMAKEYKVNFRKHFSKLSILEGVFARGGRELAPVLHDAFLAGARFDGWQECFNYGLWTESLAKFNLNENSYHQAFAEDALLPWDHIHVGVEKDFLLQEWKKANLARPSIPCGKPAHELIHYTNLEDFNQNQDKKLVCYHCGIKCDLTEMLSERKEFLTHMEAHNKIDFSSQKAPEVTSVLDHREKRGQFVGHKYRLNFSKLGSITYISHLDLQKVGARIFKRAGIEVLYSEGHNLRPLLSFGPALPLGINSLCEFIDLRCSEEWTDFQSIIDKLNFHSEKGIIFNSIEKLESASPSIQEGIVAFEYFLPVFDLPSPEIIEELNNSPSLIIDSFSKKDQREIEKDMRPFITNISLAQGLPLPEEKINLIDEVTPCKNMSGLVVKVKVKQAVSARPSEILSLIRRAGINSTHVVKTQANFFL